MSRGAASNRGPHKQSSPIKGFSAGNSGAKKAPQQRGMRVPNEEARKREAFSKLTRLMISAHDFQQALSAATFLVQDFDESAEHPLADLRRFRCYETAMIIAYARPFSMAKGEVRPLRWSDTGLSRTAAEKSLHAKLIKHRNTVYAHSDAEFVRTRVMVMHHYFEHNDVDLSIAMPRFEEGMRFSLAEVNAIQEMLHKLIHSIFHKCQKLGAEFKDQFTTYEWNIAG